jgi:hypothetical protein
VAEWLSRWPRDLKQEKGLRIRGQVSQWAL